MDDAGLGPWHGCGPSSRCDGLSGKLASADCVWSRCRALQPDDTATPAHLAQHEAMVSPRDWSARSSNSFRRPQSRFESVEGVPGCAQPAHAGPHRLAEQLTTFTLRFQPCMNRSERAILFT